MTPTQSKHIRKGARRITEAANNAANNLSDYAMTIVGTWESKRGIRTFRGREVR